MRTTLTFFLLLPLLPFGCASSSSTPITPAIPSKLEANYTLEDGSPCRAEKDVGAMFQITDSAGKQKYAAEQISTLWCRSIGTGIELMCIQWEIEGASLRICYPETR